MVYIYIHTMEYHSAIKKNEIIPFAAIWMDLERIVLTEGNQSKKKDRCHYDITYMWDLNKMKETNEL